VYETRERSVNGKIIQAGTYTISKDRRYFLQDGRKDEILKLTRTELVVKVRKVAIVYYKRVT
jgi:hypothetical protein